MSIGVPVKLLHEGEGSKISIELKSGETYRGILKVSEDNMNCQLESVTITTRDGKSTNLGYVFIRGSMIRFISLPDSLKNSPTLTKLRT